MRNLLVVLLFGIAFLRTYVLKEFPSLPNESKYALDFVLAFVGVVCIARLVATGRWARIPVAYLLLFAFFISVVAVAAIVNGMSPDVLFAGVRNYFRFIVPFLIPIAFDFSDNDREFHAKVFVALLLCQAPVTLWQRLFEFDSFTGDTIAGTLSTTSSVSILCAVAVVLILAAYVGKRISFSAACALFLAALIPAGLSETKATPIFLIAGVGALLFAQRTLVNSRQLFLASMGVFVFIVGFIGIYDMFYTRSSGEGYLDLMTNKERMIDNYNFTGVQAKSLKFDKRSSVVVGDKQIPLNTLEEKEVGRVDTVTLPFDVLLPQEALRLIVGLGIGNVDSSFGKGGDYRIIKFELGGARTTISILIWETGLIGLTLFFGFLFLLARDSYHLAQREGPGQAFAAGFFGVCAVTGAGLIYANLFHLAELSCLIAFLSGSVVADRMKLRDVGPQFDALLQPRQADQRVLHHS